MRADLLHADGRTDGHEEANSRFSQFCEHAYRQKQENTDYFRTHDRNDKRIRVT